MGWDDYVNAILATGQAHAAGLYSHDGGKWAATNLEPSAAEVSLLVQAIKSEGAERNGSYTDGIYFNGQKFNVIKYEDNEIWKGASKEPERAACAYLCNMCIIIAIADGGQSASGPLNVLIQKYQSFLKESGY